MCIVYLCMDISVCVYVYECMYVLLGLCMHESYGEEKIIYDTAANKHLSPKINSDSIDPNRSEQKL